MKTTNSKKQLKITKLFRRGMTQLPEDCDELQEEVQQLEQRLREKQEELFQLQRNSYRRRASAPKKKSEPFFRPEKIIQTNWVETLKCNLEVLAMLSGMEVQSYVADKHCSVVYHMQHQCQHELKHGLRIDMKNGVNEVSKSSLPLGFNLSAVLDGFKNVMLPECLVAVRKGLVAYYDRLSQFDRLRKMVNMEAELFKILDGSHVEIKFTARSERETEDEQIPVTLMLDYRVYDIRPKQYSFIEIDLPDGAADGLRAQCSVFIQMPLHKAFKEAFIEGNGDYVMVKQVGTQPAVARRRRRNRRQHDPCNRHDDTFHPEDCSDSDDEDVDN